MISSTSKRDFYTKVLTIYGRKPILEALNNFSLKIYRLHLAKTNRSSKDLDMMEELAQKRKIEIKLHSKKELSYISKNSKQDQGVALDIVLENLIKPESFIEKYSSFRLIALDRVTNPQNVGMIIRSCTAGNIDGLLLGNRGNAPLVSPLTIKASTGTIFKLPIIRSNSLKKGIEYFQKEGTEIYTLDSHSNLNYKNIEIPKRSIFILGNESDGVSSEIKALSDKSISIPMQRGVESLNVAVTASLLAFCTS